MVENHLGGHDSSEPMPGDAVALGKREQMDDGRPPIAILRRVEQMMGNTGQNEIPVCFIDDEGDASGLGEFCECTQELRSVDGASLRARLVSENRRVGFGVCTGLFGVTRTIAFVLSVKSDSQTSTFG